MLARRTALITGSTDGVGRTVALRLGEAGMRVFVHGRDGGRGKAVVAAIAAAGGTASFHGADLSSLADVRSLAETIRRETGRLDLLINNAGVGTGGPDARRETSKDGHELRFAVNYLAGFLLTALLTPLIEASTPARIVNVSSLGQAPIDFDDVMLVSDYSGVQAYCQSKLAQIMFTIDLAAAFRKSSVIVTALHPATYMDTTMVHEAGLTPLNSVDTGAEAILNLALSPDIEGKSGRFYNGLREAKAHAQAYDAKARAKLRSLSLDLTGLGAFPAG
jgi:NAD(P)-dependent dehydrogenase (short-subunit alcohol dehydrogenase family)